MISCRLSFEQGIIKTTAKEGFYQPRRTVWPTIKCSPAFVLPARLLFPICLKPPILDLLKQEFRSPLNGKKMAFDEGLAERIRNRFADQQNVEEKKMFGGLCFMLNHHMCCGVIKDELMVRVGKDRYQEALAQVHAREMNFTGKALTGMVYVSHQGITEDEQLEEWIQRGIDFVNTLPPK